MFEAMGVVDPNAQLPHVVRVEVLYFEIIHRTLIGPLLFGIGTFMSDAKPIFRGKIMENTIFVIFKHPPLAQIN
ncbi:hypothetical protein [Pseudomonas sp. PIC25]|uniref:hypothetical protein n=1 Tax=Pseudomonas sp. PIC25 TaxID=1958773 RepID=UPI002114FA2C|nr:hypothetical protein [Pseudomonas sp. PIC25]